MNCIDFLKVYNFDTKRRLGINADGGYVIGELEGKYDCYISCGVSNEESFSKDFINLYDMNEYNSFAFDGTINEFPYHYTNKISFIKKNINYFNDDKNSNLFDIIDKYNNIFLKMDIEGYEYQWLSCLDNLQLSKFKQIVIEFHDLNNLNFCSIEIPENLKNKIFKKISDTHYLIHAHGNSCCGVINKIPNNIELTYVNKNYFNLTPNLNTTPLPIYNLDFSNGNDNNQIDLNFYPFTNNL
jgi:hypothetical protein